MELRTPIQKQGNDNDDFTNFDSYWGWEEYSATELLCVWRNGEKLFQVGDQVGKLVLSEIKRDENDWILIVE